MIVASPTANWVVDNQPASFNSSRSSCLAMRTLILEDDRDRRMAMMTRLIDRFPMMQIFFFDASAEMIEFLQTETLQNVALIALDNDLELIPGLSNQWIDPGAGLDVANWLANHSEPTCPVIVHTTNLPAGDKMIEQLRERRWAVSRVIPHDDLTWVDQGWLPAVRNAIVETAPQRVTQSASS